MPQVRDHFVWLVRRALAAVIMVGLFSAAVQARTWRIRPDRTGDAPTIQAGIDSAATRDSLLIAAGTYDENLDTHGKELSLLGESRAEATIIDGGRRSGVLIFNAGVLANLTLRNGLAEVGGGGIWIQGRGSSILRNNIIEDNIAGTMPDTGGGGGVYIDGLADHVILESNVIRNNSSTAVGGGVHDAGPGPLYVFNELRNNIIMGNHTVNFGADISMSGTIVTGNLILNNYSDRAGGGIAVNSQGEIRNNTIVSNAAGSDGAGILAFGNPTISHNIVAFNGPGGGILFGGQTPPDCNDLWRNDVDPMGWPGHGNLSVDPLFCNAAGANFYLFTNSPCLPEQNPTCGRIGAFPAACDTTFVQPVSWGHVKKLYQ